MDQAPETDEIAPVAEEARKGTAYGAILGIILIVVVLVVGAFYVWGERLKKQNEVMIPENGVRGEVPSDPMMQGSAELDASVPQPI